jgi:hypothetical protein
VYSVEALVCPEFYTFQHVLVKDIKNVGCLTNYIPMVTICTASFNFQQILRSAQTVYLCVLYGSENKQPLFPYTALTDWFV